jgi:hypothetical protein
MHVRTGLGLLICCCAALAACTAAPKTPAATVTAPAVGRPPAPASAEAAVSTEAFTPYAALGISANDGLAPGESLFTFAADCMTAAGYPSAAYSSTFVEDNLSLAIAVEPFAQPWGGWGYLGATDAQQYGFSSGFTSVLSTLGIDAVPNPPSLSPAEQAAAGNCATIQQDLANPIEAGPLALIGTLAKDIATDVAQDPAVQAATRAWSACMTKNGYSFPQPQDVSEQEKRAMYGNEPPPDRLRAASRGRGSARATSWSRLWSVPSAAGAPDVPAASKHRWRDTAAPAPSGPRSAWCPRTSTSPAVSGPSFTAPTRAQRTSSVRIRSR